MVWYSFVFVSGGAQGEEQSKVDMNMASLCAQQIHT